MLYSLTEELYEAQHNIEEVGLYLEQAGRAYLDLEKKLLSLAKPLARVFPSATLTKNATISEPTKKFIETITKPGVFDSLATNIDKNLRFTETWKEIKKWKKHHRIMTNFDKTILRLKLLEETDEYLKAVKVGKAKFWTHTKLAKYIANDIKDLRSNYSFKNGLGNAANSLAGLSVSMWANYMGNMVEQAESGGTMSEARVIAETVTETTVGHVFSAATSYAVGAAVASASTAAAPVVAIAAGSYVLVLGIDKGVEALTGKSATEWVSDAVVNVGEVVVDGAVKLGRAVAAKTCQAGEFVINTAVKAGEAVVGKAKDCYNAVANWLDSIF